MTQRTQRVAPRLDLFRLICVLGLCRIGLAVLDKLFEIWNRYFPTLLVLIRESY
jgi:hypothetical protein